MVKGAISFNTTDMVEIISTLGMVKGANLWQVSKIPNVEKKCAK